MGQTQFMVRPDAPYWLLAYERKIERKKSMKSLGILLGVTFSIGLIAIGCSSGDSSTDEAATSPDPSLTAEYVLSEEPADVQDVAELLETVEDGQEVAVVGRVGGSPTPFIDGLAAFTLVDTRLEPCPDAEGCPTPWDYCCDRSILPKNMLTIKVVDEQDLPVEQGAASLLGIEELSMVVVHGRAAVDEAGNVSILTDGVFVRP